MLAIKLTMFLPVQERVKPCRRLRTGCFVATDTARHCYQGRGGVSEIEGEVIEGQLKLIEAPRQRKPRGEYLQRQEELRQYMAEHPGATVREIATHFGKSSSTMQAWLDKLTTGV